MIPIIKRRFKRRPRFKIPSLSSQLPKIVIGGIAGLVIGLLIIWWIGQVDPFGFGPIVSQFFPEIVPQQLQKQDIQMPAHKSLLDRICEIENRITVLEDCTPEKISQGSKDQIAAILIFLGLEYIDGELMIHHNEVDNAYQKEQAGYDDDLVDTNTMFFIVCTPIKKPSKLQDLYLLPRNKTNPKLVGNKKYYTKDIKEAISFEDEEEAHDYKDKIHSNLKLAPAGYKTCKVLEI